MPADHPSSSAGGTKLYYYHSHPVGVHDVICGKKCERHPGNIAFRHIVRLHQRQYQSTSTREVKKRIIENIINRVTKAKNGGRFIKENDDRTGMEPVPPPYIYEKVSHALRSTTRSSSPCYSPTSLSHPSSTRTMQEEEKKEQQKAATCVFDGLLAAQQKLFYSYLMASSSSSSSSRSTTNDEELEQFDDDDDDDQWSVSSSAATAPTTTKHRMMRQPQQQLDDRYNGSLRVDPTTMSVLLGLVHNDDDVIDM
jgi:hypothetical protein